MARLIQVVASLLVFLAAACSSPPQQGGPGATSSSARPLSSAAPGSRQAVRDNTARGPFSEGFALEARALLSKVTTDDGLPIAIRFVPEVKPAGGGPGDRDRVEGTTELASLRFDIELPGGSRRTLDLAPRDAAKPAALDWFPQAMTLEPTGLTIGKVKHSWKAPGDVAGPPGAHAVTVTATLKTAGKAIVLTSGRLAIEVVAPGPTMKSLVDLERAASEVARSTWSSSSIPLPRDPTVDDVDGNVSVRFQGQDDGGRSGYDRQLLEVWLDRSGRVLLADEYLHFTCVAEGTTVATPHGPVPIEQLAVGAEVLAFDVETRTRSVARVVRKDRDRSSTLVRFGDLVVTREHPLWADGAWRLAGDVGPGTNLLGARLDPLAAQPVAIAEERVVYDLGVTPPHTYFAGGVLVHNKAVGVPLGQGRPWGAMFFRHAAR